MSSLQSPSIQVTIAVIVVGIAAFIDETIAVIVDLVVILKHIRVPARVVVVTVAFIFCVPIAVKIAVCIFEAVDSTLTVM